jgi:hypothetical protein
VSIDLVAGAISKSFAANLSALRSITHNELPERTYFPYRILASPCDSGINVRGFEAPVQVHSAVPPVTFYLKTFILSISAATGR